ncbi:hypothetical protein H1R20_g7502, partial [Candolleomyces eurysporus]
MEKRIRLFNLLNWPSFNIQTLEFLNNNPEATVTIATDTLSVGWDSQHTQDAIILGEPDDLDEFLQKIGRVGRNHHLVKHPRTFLYYSRKAMDNAQHVLDHSEASNKPLVSHLNPGAKLKPSVTMDHSISDFLLAKCYPDNINKQYNNPVNKEPCTCPRCSAMPSLNSNNICICSGCQPEDSNVPETRTSRSRRPQAKRGEGLTKAMRQLAIDQFQTLRTNLFTKLSQSDSMSSSFTPPSAYLPTDAMTALINNIYLIHSAEDV